MKEEFIERLRNEIMIDTKAYRYQYAATNAGEYITRLPIKDLGTTAAINGWEKVWENHELSLKQARINAGLSQQKMSNLLEIPKKTIEAWEGGTRKPPKYVEKLVIEKLEGMRG